MTSKYLSASCRDLGFRMTRPSAVLLVTKTEVILPAGPASLSPDSLFIPTSWTHPTLPSQGPGGGVSGSSDVRGEPGDTTKKSKAQPCSQPFPSYQVSTLSPHWPCVCQDPSLHTVLHGSLLPRTTSSPWPPHHMPFLMATLASCPRTSLPLGLCTSYSRPSTPSPSPTPLNVNQPAGPWPGDTVTRRIAAFPLAICFPYIHGCSNTVTLCDQ